MKKQTIITAALSIGILLSIGVQAKSKDNTNVPTISVTKLDIKEEALNLLYEIRNDTEDDAWVFAGWHILSEVTSGMNAGLRMAEDGHTLTIRARFNRPTKVMAPEPLYGRFVRLRSGDRQTEAIFIRLPACPASQSGHVGQQEQGIKHARRLAIELGYFQDNLSGKKPNDTLVSRNVFSRRNERLNSRDDEILIVDDRLEVKREDEQVIRTLIENLNIPYEKNRNYMRKIKSPGLHSYDKIEIQYKPSILEFFFPYKSQQSLLSPDEIKYLQSDKTIVLNNAQDIYTIAHFIPHTRADTTVFVGIPVRFRSHAEVACYTADKPFISFHICNDDTIVIDGYELFSFEGLPSLKKLTPQIQPIDLRMRCAANLKNLWYRLHYYNFQESLRKSDPFIRSKTPYPIPSEWCDDMPRLYPTLGGGRMGGSRTSYWGAKPHICPSAGNGKNHYAMNPNCKPDSLPDMVLLFETKAGWNQHGGPELFTFDNHDPKGGCVLLNDGTVKFIRTPEELRQFRWK
jgi:hypothetical protein